MPKGIYIRNEFMKTGKYIRSEIHKKQISKTLSGRKLSKKTKNKMRKARLGIPSGMLGKKQTKETIEKRKETFKKRKVNQGNKNGRWNGGTSFLPYSINWTETLKRAIRERNNYICQICSQYGYDVHHIDYNKLNCNIKNLITLCRSCHIKTNHNREYWIKYFKGEKK